MTPPARDLPLASSGRGSYSRAGLESRSNGVMRSLFSRVIFSMVIATTLAATGPALAEPAVLEVQEVAATGSMPKGATLSLDGKKFYVTNFGQLDTKNVTIYDAHTPRAARSDRRARRDRRERALRRTARRSSSRTSSATR